MSCHPLLVPGIAQLQSHLESFNLQATLIVGFALSTLNADNLVAISDDQSKFCMYKQPVVAGLWAVLTVFSIGACMTCLGLSFYVIVRSQRTANEVSVKHTVALVRQLKGNIISYYMFGMLAFFLSLLLLIWMCVYSETRLVYTTATVAAPTRDEESGTLLSKPTRARSPESLNRQVHWAQQLGQAHGRSRQLDHSLRDRQHRDEPDLSAHNHGTDR